MTIVRRVLALVLAATLGLGALGIATADAVSYAYSGVRIRASKTATGTVKGLGYPGQSVTVYSDSFGGDHVNCAGYIDDYWTYHRNNSTGVTGYSSWSCITAH